jgi:uncharacterized membrane protein YeiH
MVPGYVAALSFLDYLGIAVFAISGALVAARKRQDFVTFVFLAVVTGVGGGTARDLMIGAPIFWIHENWTLLICIFAALVVWVAPASVWGGGSLLWADALGIAVYAAYGAAKGMAYGVAPVPAAAMGILTACLGGILRDVLAGEPSILLRQEYYVSAAALSAGLMVGLSSVGLAQFPAAAIAIAAGLTLRSAAILRGWSLPPYRR